MAIDLRSKQGIALVAGIALLTLAVGFGAAFLMSRGAVKDAEERARLAEEQVTSTQPSETPPAVEPTASVEPTPAATGDTPTTTGIEDGTFFTFIEKVTVTGGTAYVTADYAQMLTGDAAAAAATKAGDESPPPNDYYIVNENQKLRNVPVSASIKVLLSTWEAHFAVEGYPVEFSEWSDMINGVTDDFPRATMVPYWITIKNGKATKIAEQYLP